MPILQYLTNALEGADVERIGEEVVEPFDQSQETSHGTHGADIFVDIGEASTESAQSAPSTQASRQTEMDSAAKDMRMVALRCQDMPEVTRETRLLRKTVSDGAKSIMSGLDSSSSQCHQQLLDILDDGESNLVAAHCSTWHDMAGEEASCSVVPSFFHLFSPMCLFQCFVEHILRHSNTFSYILDTSRMSD